MATRKLVWAGEIDDELVAKVYRGGWSSLTLCSYGGDIYAARAIVDYLLRRPKPVLVTGACFSAAIAIAVAGEVCYATPGTKFMVHPPSIEHINGLSRHLGNEAKELDEWLAWYLSLLADRTDADRQTWKEMLEADTYFGVLIAQELGLVDGVEG